VKEMDGKTGISGATRQGRTAIFNSLIFGQFFPLAKTGQFATITGLCLVLAERFRRGRTITLNCIV
jgi:hypothetical protein